MPAIGTVTPRLHKQGVPIIDTQGAWVGSKAGKRGDLVTLDANGRYDQVVAASNAVTSASGRLAMLDQTIKSTVAADGRCQAQKFDDEAIIALPCATSAGAAKATTASMKGKLFPLYRDANGNYVVNTDSNTNPVVECVGLDPTYAVGELGGIMYCRVIQTCRLA